MAGKTKPDFHELAIDGPIKRHRPSYHTASAIVDFFQFYWSVRAPFIPCGPRSVSNITFARPNPFPRRVLHLPDQKRLYSDRLHGASLLIRLLATPKLSAPPIRAKGGHRPSQILHLHGASLRETSGPGIDSTLGKSFFPLLRTNEPKAITVCCADARAAPSIEGELGRLLRGGPCL